MEEVAVPRELFRKILGLIDDLRLKPDSVQAGLKRLTRNAESCSWNMPMR
jgi:hypothetical protein